MDVDKILSQVEIDEDGDFSADSQYDALDIMEESEDPSVFIQPILDFMGKHPSSHFGNPGPFVHFVEEYGLDKYSRQDYEALICASFRKSPSIVKMGMILRCCGADNPSSDNMINCIKEVRASQNLHPELALYIDEVMSD